jgi:hypothetical protein
VGRITILVLAEAGAVAHGVVRTADSAKHGLKESDFRRTVRVTEVIMVQKEKRPPIRKTRGGKITVGERKR